MMKKVLLFLLLASVCLPGIAQKKNSLRAGVGVDILNRNLGGYPFTLGPAVFLEYNRRINDWLGITGGGFSSSNTFGKSGEKNVMSEWNVSSRAIFTPFDKFFRYLKIGGGVSWSNMKLFIQYLYVDEYARYTQNNFGLDIVARLYVVDNERFEFFGSYESAYWPNDRFGGTGRDNAGLFFGVKF